jgi:hypothetical protein
MERLAIRARRTGRQATKTPLTCERAEDSSGTFNAADPSAPPSGTTIVEEPSSVSFKMAFWSSAASFWSFSIDSKYEHQGLWRCKVRTHPNHGAYRCMPSMDSHQQDQGDLPV